MSTRALEIIETKQVMFYEDELTAVKGEDGTIYVPMRQICDRLGINWSSQAKRIRRDPVLSEEIQSVVIMTTHRGKQETLCLPLTYMHGWLFGLTASRVKKELQEQLIKYQRDCYRILSEAFVENKVTARIDEEFEDLLQSDKPSAIAYRNALAIVNLARQQVILESRLDRVADHVDIHDERISLLEATLGNPARIIDNKQASQISQAVKAIGLELGKRSGRNEFGGVYGELYRRFEIAGYRELPATRYDEAINFLSDWYSSITNSDLPF